VPTSAPVAPSDPVAFIRNYYGLLPGNPDAALQLLGPQAQERSKGRSSYEGFWATVATVSLQNTRQTGENTVETTVLFTLRDGTTSNEAYRFVLGNGPDGQTIMESFSGP
jgi:eukaryotic-like serine/threonine-protein kinase